MEQIRVLLSAVRHFCMAEMKKHYRLKPIVSYVGCIDEREYSFDDGVVGLTCTTSSRLL